MWTKIFYALSFLLNVSGLGGVPDDIKSWRAAMNWLSTYISCDLLEIVVDGFLFYRAVLFS